MNRSKRLQPIIELAEQKANQGLQAIGYMQQRVAEETDKMQQLEESRKFINPSHAGQELVFNASYLKSISHFSTNLEVAILQQSQQIAAVEAQLLEVRELWQKLDAKARNLQKTQSKIERQEYSELARKEQKSNDEYVTQKLARLQTINRH